MSALVVPAPDKPLVEAADTTGRAAASVARVATSAGVLPPKRRLLAVTDGYDKGGKRVRQETMTAVD